MYQLNIHAKALLKLTVLFCLIHFSHGECPQVSFDSLLVRFCNFGDSKKKCIDRVGLQECVGPESILEDTTYLQIYTEVSVLRRGFIHDLPELTTISGAYNNISRILPGAFLNLPKIDSIDIAASIIKEVLWGVFNGMPASSIELSSNYISYIENEAFSNMPNLKRLDLSGNRLKFYKKNWLLNSTNLEKIILTRNQIERIPTKAFSDLVNLKHVDLSFNKLKQLDNWIFNNVRKLDLLDFTSNKFWYIPPGIFGEGTEIETLKVSLNYLSYLDLEIFERGNVKSVMLHPNPWQCSCLEEMLKWMGEHNTTLIDVKTDNRVYYHPNEPECSVSPVYKDKCFKAPDEEYYATKDTFLAAVNYTNWHYVSVSRSKPDCECDY